MKVTGPSDLIAAIPHVMGFVPYESVLVVPTGTAGPCARLDQPSEPEDIAEAAKVLAMPFLRDRIDVAVVSFTKDRAAAEKTCHALTRLLGEHVRVAPVLWVCGEEWTDLNTGITGHVCQESRARMAAESVFAGHRMPAASRDDLALDLQGTADEISAVAAQLQAARAYVAGLGDGDLQDEAGWIRDVIGIFVEDQVPPTHSVAARILAGTEILLLRDAAWEVMERDNAQAHVALWRDLTRRAPLEVRMPAAALLAFSSWLAGNGAQAHIALDLVPDHKGYALAQMTETLLQEALSPKLWDTASAPHVMSSPSSLLQQAHLSGPACRGIRRLPGTPIPTEPPHQSDNPTRGNEDGFRQAQALDRDCPFDRRLHDGTDKDDIDVSSPSRSLLCVRWTEVRPASICVHAWGSRCTRPRG